MIWPMVIGVLGGIGIFLYGMYIASEGLKKSASHHLKNFLSKVTKNQFFGSLAGITLAAVLQSSSAATVMVVGFVNAGLLTLRQAMGLMLGSAIGTTITVQLIAFKITDYALLFIALGVCIFLLSKQQMKSIGSIVLGFGFVFFGMAIITDAMLPIQHNPELTNAFIYLTDNLLLTVLIALIFTAIIQNSAAAIAIAMTLAASGSLTIEASIAIVYGANVGTVVTALISSISSSKDAQRTAVAHAIFKIIGVLLFLPFTQLFVYGLEAVGGGIERQIANAHTIFNIVNLLVLLPFCNKFADWMVLLLPYKEKVTKHIKYLENESLEVPTIALIQTRKELGNMAKLIDEHMLHHFDDLLDAHNPVHRQAVIRYEDNIDEIYKSIYHYLQKITQKDLTDEESEESLKYLYINNHLEGISDSLQHIALTTTKLEGAQTNLKEWEAKGISHLFEEVSTNYHMVINAFDENDREKAIEVINRNPIILRKEKDLRFQHFNSGSNQSSRLSSVYVDIMNELIMLNHHIVSISYTLIGMV
ncbi:hypothetical protein AJ85_01160 [Alkalihalobacillus alcalophilus ATCC 27647 = CGMCC 1.3604]|nr:Na/Pi cotransporter family protein [Alkalihalobacillus alcalophilus]MED1562608.1 Na/Pi cotransporter family protein [Alkalihalobacillus alcalophilus]THG91863.1 hypothetical protein AJ85_01160 [Alkalihalobacillus alcalophilus ATCC 27647 = CGMCC 1.3604]